jgi:hypothetical protein
LVAPARNVAAPIFRLMESVAVLKDSAETSLWKFCPPLIPRWLDVELKFVENGLVVMVSVENRLGFTSRALLIH